MKGYSSPRKTRPMSTASRHDHITVAQLLLDVIGPRFTPEVSQVLISSNGSVSVSMLFCCCCYLTSISNRWLDVDRYGFGWTAWSSISFERKSPWKRRLYIYNEYIHVMLYILKYNYIVHHIYCSIHYCRIHYCSCINTSITSFFRRNYTLSVQTLCGEDVGKHLPI